MIDNRLMEFGIVRARDIIASTTDGASIMRKFGRLLDCENQACHSHGIHLAVADVLYKRQIQQEPEERDNLDEDDEDSEGGEASDCDEISKEISDNALAFADSLKELINKVRKIVKLFRKSPVKNDFLANCCKENDMKDIKLILDCKTRWNSLKEMLGSFL